MQELSQENFPNLAMMLSGVLYPLQILELPTSENGGGALHGWATPNTMDVLPSRSFDAMKKQARTRRKNRHRPGNLREQIDPLMQQAYDEARTENNWPTPRSREGNAGNTGSIGSKHNAQRGYLDGVVQETWPTPVSDDTGNRKKKYAQGGTPLSMASGNWPTPRVSDTEGGVAQNVEMENGSFSRKNKDGVRWGVKLRDATETWPTPSANEDAAGLPTGKMQKMLGNHPNLRDPVGTFSRKNKDGVRWGVKLRDATETWPTPSASSGGTHTGISQETAQKELERGNQIGLGAAASLLTTPHGPQAHQTEMPGKESLENDQTSPQPSPKRLNANFVEWMMGLPIGWTDLKPVEMESYLRWSQNFLEE
jgi:hypothetical protein